MSVNPNAEGQDAAARALRERFGPGQTVELLNAFGAAVAKLEELSNAWQTDVEWYRQRALHTALWCRPIFDDLYSSRGMSIEEAAARYAPVITSGDTQTNSADAT